jgi:DNA-binding GntR family transcriptional regulator
LTDADLEALQRALDELIHAHEADDRERFRRAMHEFRAGLFIKAGDRLTALIHELTTHANRYASLFVQLAEEDPATLYARARSEHTALMEAARARDGDAGATLVARHLSRTVLTVIASLRPDYDPKLVRSALPLALRGQTL